MKNIEITVQIFMKVGKVIQEIMRIVQIVNKGKKKS